VELRSVTEADGPFLAALYASTRDDLAAIGLAPEGLAALLAQQLDARTRHHAAHHPDASDDVIEVDGAPAGRLVVARPPEELRLVDVALLPAHRGRGVGSRVLAAVLAEADGRGVPVVLYVEPGNPAARLYGRLGFRPSGDAGIHRRLVRPPAGAAPQPKTAS
jgi:ribosomal protein S18 acetylase RimI-like enzyme